MSRDTYEFEIDDLSAFASHLRKQLSQSAEFPSHLSFMGMIARASGYRNLQHLQGQVDKGTALDQDVQKRLARALRVFDSHGKMAQWPAATNIQGLCLWPIWFDLAGGNDFTEQQVNAAIVARISFEDYPLVRRSLIDHKLMIRTTDGRIYTCQKGPPPPEAIALMQAIKRR